MVSISQAIIIPITDANGNKVCHFQVIGAKNIAIGSAAINGINTFSCVTKGIKIEKNNSLVVSALFKGLWK